MIIVSGATGFIGRALVSELESLRINYESISIRLSDLDILDDKFWLRLKKNSVTAFLHLGWPVVSNTNYRFSDENDHAGKLTIALASKCLKYGISFLTTGSPAEFMPDSSKYAFTKLQVRRQLGDLIDLEKISWLRPWYVFDRKQWPLYLRDADAGNIPLITDDRLLYFIDVRDVAHAIIAIIQNDLRGEIDISGMKAHKPSELLAALDLPFTIAGNQVFHPAGKSPDLTRILNLGWLPSHTEETFEFSLR